MKNTLYLFSFFLFFIATFVSSISFAQPVCNGTWGAPIVNQTFGEGVPGTNFYGPLNAYAPGASTSAIFLNNVTGNNFPDGDACLTTSPFLAHGSDWVTNGDHTGDPNGLMFLINAPSTGGTVFFEDTMFNLCPNTVLQFSVWILNVNITSLSVGNPTYQYPNMTINLIDVATNTIIATTNTGDVPNDATWHQYTLVFNNANSANVKMQLVNNSVGSGFGNDLALDDITVSPCVPISHVSPRVDTVVCQPSVTIPFTAQISGNIYNPPNYLWQYSNDSGTTWINGTPISTNTNYTFSANTSGIYWVRFLVGPTGFNGNGNCSGVSDTSIIQLVTTIPNYNAIDTVICHSELFEFKAAHNGDSTQIFQWETSTDLGASWTSLPPSKDSTYDQIVFLPGSYWVRYLTYPEGLENAKGCQRISDTSKIRRNADIKVSENISDASCFNKKDGIIKFNIGSGQLPLTFLAQPGGASNQTGNFTNMDTGSYIIYIADADNKCLDTVGNLVIQQPDPLLIRDSIIKVPPTCLKDADGSLTVAAYGGTYPYIYELDPANLYTVDGTFTGLYANNYTLNVKDDHNCKVSEPIELTADACCKVFVPTAFTPNNDGKNDYFKASSNSAIHSIDLHVYNRYGQEVYHSTSTEDKGWDGTFSGEPAEVGTYFYAATYFCEDVNQEYTLKGTVTLIR